ncbi:MAG TPA: pyruvate kinase [Candidatus Merdicola faecigallinarum]|uniref:Pyruvate kinase n=1 Tax=Candidatus Merdicola faecigallinarum TaxID=2840862 RepID=A0A9D1SA96_9FIRM|nr:pyruvate kinase [Candidatus Merdicola faecigallinarum]
MKKNLRKTNIVCTIGPASEKRLEELMKTGMSVARINFSHGSYPEQEEKINDFLAIREKLGMPVAMLLDMQGPEVRTGMLVTGKNVKVELKEGDPFVFYNEDMVGDEKGVSISYKDLYKDVKPGDTILIDDGAINVQVKEIKGKDIHCQVVDGGKLGSRKSVNVPGVPLKLPALKEKDIQDLIDGARVGFDYVAGSFVRNKEDVLAIRKVLDEHGGQDIKIICKIENQEGIDNFEEILANSDGIMVARGDMAVEVPFEVVPVVQKRFIKRCNEEGKLVITATQMLESMTENPLPTRAEVSDVANAVYDRTACVMLSGECAMGKYPVKCVDTMVRVAKSVEPTINYWKRFTKKDFKLDVNDIEGNVAYTTCVTARDIKADAIVAYTHTGNSVRRISGMGAQCPIFAITDCKKTYNQLAPTWNVFPILVENEKNIKDTITKGMEKLKQEGTLEKGDTIVLAGGPNIVSDEKEEYEVNKTIGGVVRI